MSFSAIMFAASWVVTWASITLFNSNKIQCTAPAISSDLQILFSSYVQQRLHLKNTLRLLIITQGNNLTNIMIMIELLKFFL